MKSLVSLAAILLLSLVPTALMAKNATIAIYGVVEQVTFEPDDAPPNLVRISGVFVVPISDSSGLYQSPQRGYLYFRIRPGMEQATRNDWNDLKSIAGTGQVVGFGEYWVANPADPSGNPHRSLQVTVHAGNAPASPEAYPLPNRKGIVRRGDQGDPKFDSIAAQLQQALRHSPSRP